MPRKIDVYFSMPSPWTYLGHDRFQEIARRHDAEVAYRPVNLATVVAETGGLPLAQRHVARQNYRLVELQRWRAAYKAFGVKKTSYRSSVERLLKAVQQGRGLPRVNSLVDAYNAVSLQFRMPVGADDFAKLEGDLAFRIARPGDNFFALGAETPSDDPPKAGEVVYADAEKLLCRRWNWYQDARSATSLETREAVLTVQSLETDPAPAAAALADWLSRHCGAGCAWAVAERSRPVADVEL